MSRTLNRPMFRRGGQADGGITSGLRRGYANGSQSGMQKIQRDLQIIDQLAPQRGGALNDFLINWGLNMVGNPPSGGIFQTAAKEAQQPFQQFQQSKARESLGRRELVANLVKNLSEDEKYKLQVEAQHLFDAGAVNPFTNQPFKSAEEALNALVKNKFMSKEKVLTEEAQFENTYNEFLRKILSRDEGDFEEDNIGAARLAHHEAKVHHEQYPEKFLDALDGAQYIPLGAVDWTKPNPDGSFQLTKKVGVNAMNYGTLKPGKVYFNVSDKSFYKFNGKSFTVIDIAEYD